MILKCDSNILFCSFLRGHTVLLYDMLRGDAGGDGDGDDVPALHRRLLQGEGPALDRLRSDDRR